MSYNFRTGILKQVFWLLHTYPCCFPSLWLPIANPKKWLPRGFEAREYFSKLYIKNALIIAHSRSLHHDFLELEMKKLWTDLAKDSQIVYINIVIFWSLWPICKGRTQNPLCEIFPTYLDGFLTHLIFTWRRICDFGTSACSLYTYQGSFPQGRSLLWLLRFYKGVICDQCQWEEAKETWGSGPAIRLTLAPSIAVPLLCSSHCAFMQQFSQGEREFQY